MLGWIIAGILGAAAVGAIIVYVTGTINRNKIKEKMREQGVKNAIIDSINNCDNVVSLRDIENDTQYEIHGDDIDYNIDEGDVIYV